MTPKGKHYGRWLAQQAARRERIKAMAAKGISYSEIARKLGVSRQRARELVNA